MSAARQLHEMGVAVEVRNGKLNLMGLDTLKTDEARKVLELARTNKAALLAELSGPEWSGLGIEVEHPGNGTPGELVRHRSGRLAIRRSGGVLLTVVQDVAGRWVQ